MKKFLLIFTALSIISTACSNDRDTAKKSEDITPEILEVTIHTPEKIKANEEISIEAHVVQGKEKIKDADEVKFEIWKSGQDDHEMLQAHNEKNGTYSIKTTFKEGGNYFIVAHTTANSLHSMPKEEVTVEGIEEDDSSQSETQHDHEDHEDAAGEHEHSDHHGSTVGFEFHVHSPISMNQSTELTVHLTQTDEPLPAAAVRYEIWGENETKHEFIETKESSAGAYTANYTFKSKGTYHVKIHVEKGEIHDHTEKTVEVN